MQPVDGRGLGDPGVTVLHACEVVSDKYPTGFAVETDVVLVTLLVLGFGTRKGEVDGESLALDVFRSRIRD